MIVAETERLLVRWFEPDDAGFILELVNEPSWIRFIGDKNVRDVEGARAYLERGPIDSYRKRGFGLNLVALRASGAPIGMCGLIKRDSLPDVDIGFAFVPEHWGKGYAFEAASAVLERAKDVHAMRRVVAIASPGNRRSIDLLGRLGMAFEAELDLAGDGDKTLLFARNF